VLGWNGVTYDQVGGLDLLSSVVEGWIRVGTHNKAFKDVALILKRCAVWKRKVRCKIGNLESAVCYFQGNW
jgi:hypothetical protein